MSEITLDALQEAKALALLEREEQERKNAADAMTQVKEEIFPRLLAEPLRPVAIEAKLANACSLLGLTVRLDKEPDGSGTFGYKYVYYVTIP